MSYKVQIRRTDYRVAHIAAEDFGSLGFGEAYAQAEDNADIMARLYLRNRGELSHWFGVGHRDGNLLSDVGYRALAPIEAAERALPSQSPDVTAWVQGFADGFNHWCNEQGSTLPEWYPRITPEDVHAAQWSAVCVGGAYAKLIALAQPPDGDVSPSSAEPDSRQNGSNAIALGRQITKSGKGMLLINPHFLWYGPGRFWEKHLTLPGKLNVYGINFIGCPGVAFGFNEHLAWSHTRAFSVDTAFYRISFDSDVSLRYTYGKERYEVEAKPVSVAIRTTDGAIETVTRKVWHSHHGLLISHPAVRWTQEQALAMQDVCRDNTRLIEQWLAYASADSMEALINSAGTVAPTGVLHTTAVDAHGRVFYRDTSGTANLGKQALTDWEQRLRSDKLAQALDRQGIVLLDGNNPAHALVEDERSSLSGCVPAEDAPTYRGEDYAFNANDSYWLANAQEPIEGAPRTFGPERSERSLRTRVIAQYLEGFREEAQTTLRDLQEKALGNESMAAQLLLQDLIEAAETIGEVELGDETIGLEGAVAALKKYQGRLELNASGAVLFREWLNHYVPDMSVGGLLLNTNQLFEAPFDVDEPIATPNSLAHSETLALTNLAKAVKILETAGIGRDATLGDVQQAYSGIPVKKIPVHGGQHWEGVSNAIYTVPDPSQARENEAFEKVDGSAELTTGGYPINAGGSYIATVEFTSDGPRAQGFLVYGQTADVSDPASHEQIEMFASKEWRPMYFKDSEIKQAVRSEKVLKGVARGAE